MKRYYVSLKEPYPCSRLKLLMSGRTFERERLEVKQAAVVATRPSSSEMDNLTAKVI